MNAFCNPSELLGIQCKIPVPFEAVREMCTLVLDETGPRGSWITEDFRKVADEVYLSIGSPALTLDNAWEVFTAMSNTISTIEGRD
jgi:hypothetical protein